MNTILKWQRLQVLCGETNYLVDISDGRIRLAHKDGIMYALQCDNVDTCIGFMLAVKAALKGGHTIK